MWRQPFLFQSAADPQGFFDGNPGVVAKLLIRACRSMPRPASVYNNLYRVLGLDKITPLAQVIVSHRDADSGTGSDPYQQRVRHGSCSRPASSSPKVVDEANSRVVKLYADVEVPVYYRANAANNAGTEGQLVAPYLIRVVSEATTSERSKCRCARERAHRHIPQGGHMSVAGSVATKRGHGAPNVLARLFGSGKAAAWAIARQIGEADARHRFGRTAAVSARRHRRMRMWRASTPLQIFSMLFSLGLRIDTLDWRNVRSSARRSKSQSQHRYPVIHPQRAWQYLAHRSSAGRVLNRNSRRVVARVRTRRRARTRPRSVEAAPALVVTTLDGTTLDLANASRQGRAGQLLGDLVRAVPQGNAESLTRSTGATIDQRAWRSSASASTSSATLKRLRKAARIGRPIRWPWQKLSTDDGFGIPKGVPITWIIDVDGKVRDRLIEVRDELLNGIVVPLLPH